VQIGADTITSLTENVKRAGTANQLYPTVKRSFLTKRHWNFAKAKVALARLTATPLNRWSFGYQLPADLLKLITTYPPSDYEVQGDKLYTNATTVEIDYISNVDEDLMPWFAVEALELWFAARLAIPVAQSRTLMDDMTALFQDAMNEAKAADSQQAPNTPVADAPFIDCR